MHLQNSNQTMFLHILAPLVYDAITTALHVQTHTTGWFLPPAIGFHLFQFIIKIDFKKLQTTDINLIIMIITHLVYTHITVVVVVVVRCQSYIYSHECRIDLYVEVKLTETNGCLEGLNTVIT